MAYFAEIDDTNTVIRVLVVSDDDAPRGQEFLADDLNLGGTWIQSTKSTHGGVHYGSDGEPDGGLALRYNSAGHNSIYDPVVDAFLYPAPFPSWVLDENFIWHPPVPRPAPLTAEEAEALGHFPAYEWDEATTSWVEGTE